MKRLAMLKIAYTAQNVGHLDLHRPLGDAVPIVHSLRGLSRRGHSSTFFQLQGRTVAATILSSTGTPQNHQVIQDPHGKVWRILEGAIRRGQQKLKLPYLAIFDSIRFYSVLRRILPEFDLCHEHLGVTCLGCTFATRELQKPHLVTVSADPFLEQEVAGRSFHPIHTKIARKMFGTTLRRASRVLCVSEQVRDQLIEGWNIRPQKIQIMPNGVDLDLFQQTRCQERIRREWQLGQGPIVTFVGTFQPWHGIENLVQAFQQVSLQHADARLLLIGDGEMKQSTEEQVSTLVAPESVSITGTLPMQEVADLLSVTDVAVLPYPELHRELWFSPLKLFEYMAAETAIVASRSGQIADILEDGKSGRLVRPGDIEELGSTIVELLNRPEERTRLAQKARRLAFEKYSWDTYSERLIEVYRDVLAKHGDR